MRIILENKGTRKKHIFKNKQELQLFVQDSLLKRGYVETKEEEKAIHLQNLSIFELVEICTDFNRIYN